MWKEPEESLGQDRNVERKTTRTQESRNRLGQAFCSEGCGLDDNMISGGWHSNCCLPTTFRILQGW